MFNNNKKKKGGGVNEYVNYIDYNKINNFLRSYSPLVFLLFIYKYLFMLVNINYFVEARETVFNEN